MSTGTARTGTAPPSAAPTRLKRIRLGDLSAGERRAIVERSAGVPDDVRQRAREIVRSVRDGGDAALRDANEQYGGGLPARDGAPGPLRIDRLALEHARDALDPDLRAAFERIVDHLVTFHALQRPPNEQSVEVVPGVLVARRWVPLERVGAYVPGGSAAYPSSLLMAAVPARIAGVGELVVASPADRSGEVSPALLGAAGLAGVDELLVAGGAQAIAALAYGTDSVRAVDKIVGPGSAWVTAAKLEVLGQVGIDLPAGPSEVMVLADSSADPRYVASDLLSQAEHGADSPAILVTTDEPFAEAVEREVARQLPSLPRADVLSAALAAAGLVVVAADLDEALAFVDDYAPEHLSVVVADPDAADRVRHAGSVFVGPYAPESAGDYATGANHVLPTGRLARSYGPLGVEAFGKWVQVQRVSREGLASLRETVGRAAQAEGLAAHRAAVEIRFESGGPTEGPS